jgi:hypothetical protein
VSRRSVRTDSASGDVMGRVGVVADADGVAAANRLCGVDVCCGVSSGGLAGLGGGTTAEDSGGCASFGEAGADGVVVGFSVDCPTDGGSVELPATRAAAAFAAWTVASAARLAAARIASANSFGWPLPSVVACPLWELPGDVGLVSPLLRASGAVTPGLAFCIGCPACRAPCSPFITKPP